MNCRAALAFGVLVVGAVGCGGTPQPATHAAGGGSAPSGEGWKLLVDMDKMPPPHAVTKADAILAKVAPGYANGKGECGAGKAVIATIDGGLPGAYTKPGAAENAYLVHTTPCAGGAPSHHLVVAAGDNVLVNEAVVEDTMVEIRDLDLDGDNEIVLFATLTEGTATVVKARLVDTEDAHFETLFDFGEVHRNDCAGAGKAVSSSVLRYRVTAKTMEYNKEAKAGVCTSK
jgi:hypothetical protein